MSDQEMIKRVAKAIALRDTTDEFAMARAAIKAMREPTLIMLDTAMAIVPLSEAKEVYIAMIDAILND